MSNTFPFQFSTLTQVTDTVNEKNSMQSMVKKLSMFNIKKGKNQKKIYDTDRTIVADLRWMEMLKSSKVACVD
jgi:hypothetical protein